MTKRRNVFEVVEDESTPQAVESVYAIEAVTEALLPDAEPTQLVEVPPEEASGEAVALRMDVARCVALRAVMCAVFVVFPLSATVDLGVHPDTVVMCGFLWAVLTIGVALHAGTLRWMARAQPDERWAVGARVGAFTVAPPALVLVADTVWPGVFRGDWWYGVPMFFAATMTLVAAAAAVTGDMHHAAQQAHDEAQPSVVGIVRGAAQVPMRLALVLFFVGIPTIQLADMVLDAQPHSGFPSLSSTLGAKFP